MSGGMKLEVEVRRMASGETAGAASLHGRELPHEFLTRFGPGFLSRYYRAFVESPHAAALVADVTEVTNVTDVTDANGGEKGSKGASDTPGTPDGVLIGTFDTGAHYSYLVRRHGPGLALSTLRKVAGEPGLAAEILRTRLLRYLRGIVRSLGYAVGGKSGQDEGREERVGFVAYVAVAREKRGHGVGGRLFAAYEELAREAGISRLELVTLPDERGAAPFFESLGWRREGEITSRSGERYAFFTRDLTGGEAC